MNPGPPPSTGAWAVLRRPLFRTLWIANVFSGIGSAMHDTAAVWTMTTLTSSTLLVTLMQTMSSLPLFLLALPAGALADLVDRRKVVLVAQIAALGVTLALVAAAWLDRLSPTLLLTATFGLGIAVAFITPTWQALMAEIVPRSELPGAITLGSVGINISRALGPLFGGLLLAWQGAGLVFLLNAISFLGIVTVLWRWRPAAAAAGGPQSERMVGAMVTALRFTRYSPVVRGVLVRTGVFALAGIAPMALLPLLARERQLAAADFGAWMGAYGLGGIVAAFAVLPALRRRFSGGWILNGASVLFALAGLALSLVAHRWLAAGVLFLAGGAWLVALSTLAVAGQSAFPSWVRARSSAIALIVLQGGMALGAVAWGQVAMQSEVLLALRAAAGLLLVSVLLEKVFPIEQGQPPDLAPSDHWQGHRLEREPAAEEGPVLVTLDYQVAADKAAAFRAAMARLREVRLRDGAFRWSLLQSLESPQQFRESFYVGTWGEHLRQHARATQDDRRVEEAALALHAGPTLPVARHFLLQEPGSLAPGGAQLPHP